MNAMKKATQSDASFGAELEASSNRLDAMTAFPDIPVLPKRKRAISGLVRSMFTSAWSWYKTTCARTSAKRLQITETVTLGEKRFVAILSVEGKEFLIGGSASSISLLTPLGCSRTPVPGSMSESPEEALR